MKVKFCGAATSVTGSCHLITAAGHRILLDCGQFQGGKAMEAQNRELFPFDPSEVEFVLVSHAHIDHTGRLPLLVKQGFTGKIICTTATADLLQVMLRDSGHIHEMEAEWQNRKNRRAGRPEVEPLYTVKDAEDTLKYLSPVLYDQLIEPAPGIKAVFNDAGHILGSSIIEIFAEEEGNVSKLVFSGDLGVKGRPILKDPTIIKKADYLIMETTYGNRLHESNKDSLDQLIKIVLKTVQRGGNVVIPCFAVGRTQEIIYEFNRWYEDHRYKIKELEHVMVYVDSPMAADATEVFKNNAEAFDKETKDYLLRGDNPLDFVNLKFTRTSQESQWLNMDPSPKIIMSASGMCEAGRIKHHLKHNLWNPKASIVFVGYQAEGTLGRSIVSGDKDVSIFGEKIHVNAEIYNLEGFSGHADRDGLMEWLNGFQKKPKQIFLVHGEEESKLAFRDLVMKEMGVEPFAVTEFCEVELSKDEILTVEDAAREITSPEEMAEFKDTLSDIHDDLESILYNTRLAMGNEISPERMTQINNIVMELQKATLNLGSAVTGEDRHLEQTQK